MLTDSDGGILEIVQLDVYHIVSVSSENTLKVWNLKVGAVKQVLVGHSDTVTALALLDTQHLVSASNDCTLRIWNLDRGREICSIMLDGELTRVAVTKHEGRTLVVAGDAGGALYCLEWVEPVAGN